MKKWIKKLSIFIFLMLACFVSAASSQVIVYGSSTATGRSCNVVVQRSYSPYVGVGYGAVVYRQNAYVPVIVNPYVYPAFVPPYPQRVGPFFPHRLNRLY